MLNLQSKRREKYYEEAQTNCMKMHILSTNPTKVKTPNQAHNKQFCVTNDSNCAHQPRQHILIESLICIYIYICAVHWRSFHGLISVRTMEEFRNEKNGLDDAEMKKRNCMVNRNKTF